MSLGLYTHADSAIHRLRPGVKILALAAIGTVLFLLSDWRLLVAALAAVALLYRLAQIPWRAGWAQLRPALWLLALIFAVQALIDHWTIGVTTVLRFATLILLASLVTLTTRVSAMIEALEVGLRPISHVGGNPAKVSLALSMAFRFIPVLSEVAREVGDAQRARGLDRSILAVAVPMIVKSLKMADDIADAIEARSYDPEPARPGHPD